MSEKSENGTGETPPCATKEAKNSLLTNVFIEGLLGVGKVELCFAPGQRVHVLFGENGIGKTKCLEAIWLFLLASNKDFARDHWMQHGLTPAVSCKEVVMARMSANDATFEIPENSADNRDLFPFSQVWGTGDAVWHSYPVVFLGAGRRASLDAENATSIGSLGKFADRRKKYFDALQHLLMNENGDLHSLGMSDDSRAWFVARARSANPYEETRDNRKVEIDAVLSMLHDIEPRIDAEFLKINGSDRVFLKVNGEKRELGELSSGFAALLKMILAIVAGYAAFTNEVQLRNVRGIVLIDEIDAHLHPEWQARIVPCLKKLLPNTTFYIATHSPLVLVRLMRKEAYLLKRDDDSVVRSREIRYPNRRLFDDVLEDSFGISLNRLKLDSMEDDDQSDAKQALRKLLEETREARA
jgi:hypothetical protein